MSGLIKLKLHTQETVYMETLSNAKFEEFGKEKNIMKKILIFKLKR